MLSLLIFLHLMSAFFVVEVLAKNNNTGFGIFNDV